MILVRPKDDFYQVMKIWDYRKFVGDALVNRIPDYCLLKIFKLLIFYKSFDLNFFNAMSNGVSIQRSMMDAA